MNKEELDAVLADHKRYVDSLGEEGKRADLLGANLRHADLRYANLRDADLRYADLRGADLRGAELNGANLHGADLRYADLRGANIIVLNLPYWTVYVHNETIRIGCKHYTHNEWRNFTDDEIDKMDFRALEFWSAYRDLIMTAADMV